MFHQLAPLFLLPRSSTQILASTLVDASEVTCPGISGVSGISSSGRGGRKDLEGKQQQLLESVF